MRKNQLSFDERAILTAYRRFFGERYPAQDKQNTDAHVMAQKMGFLLSLNRICIGDFGYSWNYHGPYSAGLQSLLRILDQHAALVDEFYEKNEDDSKLFTNDDQEGSLFTAEEGDQIDKLTQGLNIVENSENILDWSELLGSLAFLGNSVFPGADFAYINEKLKGRKGKYRDDEQNRRAWDSLKNADLV